MKSIFNLFKYGLWSQKSIWDPNKHFVPLERKEVICQAHGPFESQKYCYPMNDLIEKTSWTSCKKCLEDKEIEQRKAEYLRIKRERESQSFKREVRDEKY
jgi:hypothetical protein